MHAGYCKTAETKTTYAKEKMVKSLFRIILSPQNDISPTHWHKECRIMDLTLQNANKKSQTNIEEERKEEKKLSQLQKLLSGEKKVGNSLAIQIFAEFSILTIFLFIIIRMMDKSGKKTH